MKALFKLFLIALIFAIPFKQSLSQNKIVISKSYGELKFDGNLDDEAWKGATSFPMVVHTPVFGNEASEKSEIMLCYDNGFLYAGARLFDSNPGRMLVSSKKRDESEVASEEFFIILDSFNDKENAVGFSTTPAGLRNDFTIAKDAMGSDRGGPLNYNWNTFWDVKTSRNSEGWFVEMKIPFSSLRFKTSDGKVTMGLILVRRIAHKNETLVFPSIPPEWGEASCYRPSKAHEIVFEGLTSKKPFYIAPYAIGGLRQDNILNETSTGYKIDNTPKLNGGLDIKYGLTNNLTLDVTVNTDFAQVEADNEQINLTRFSLFFPEKRTFFQERSSVFAFDFEQRASMFYSRRIGLSSGEPVPIIAGARITGMAGKWDIGFLNMQTASVNDDIMDLVSSNYGVLRMRRQVFNENSYVGGIITSQLGTDGSYNTAYGADGIFRIFKNDYLNLKIAQVADKQYKNNLASLDPTRIFANWNHFNQKGLIYDFTWTRSGKYFNPSVGFQTRNDYSYYGGSAGWGWIPGENSLLQRHLLKVQTQIYTENMSGDIETAETELGYEFKFKSDFNGVLYLNRTYENVPDTFSFSADSYIPAGEYSFTQFETHLNSPETQNFGLGIDAFAGAFYDGRRFSFGLEPFWNIGSSLQLALEYNHDFLKFNRRNQKFSGGVLAFKAQYMATTKLSASAFIQYNSADDEFITNLRIRYNPHEGNDLYLVLNEGRSTYRDVENPRLPLFNSRAVLIKYTYTFTL